MQNGETVSPFRHFTIRPSRFLKPGRSFFVAGSRVYRQKTLTDNQLVNSQKDPDFCAFRAVLSQFLSQKGNVYSGCYVLHRVVI
jgi:hypothetical protein